MNKNLIIIGAGGHGRVVADIAIKMNKWTKIAFIDDDETIVKPLGMKVLGKIADIDKYIDDHDIFVAIGNNTIREKIQTKLEMKRAVIPVLTHPSAIIGTEVKIENGTAIMAGAIINCYTKIGKGCIINTGSTIDHDNIIEDYVHISPGAHIAGTVNIGKRSWLGIGSIVINNINICGNCIIGAGAVVIKNVNEIGTYVGVPTRKV